ncbi:MAG: hypothetical protein CL912_19450 [Deltaproteobacteria bacterium]|nr:hypothetical protein [Deltaproteobacteria bacterium]
MINMIFGVTFTWKKGRGQFCIKRTTGFTLMLTRGNRDSGSKKDGKPGQTSLMTCRSQSCTNTTIETATAVHLSRPDEAPTEIALGQNFHEQRMVEGESMDEKVMK